jgi:hypothetical protein
MADIYRLTGLTLPPGDVHESLRRVVTLFIPDCWQGMSRAQMMARAERLGLHLSFRATARCPSGETGVFELRFNHGEVECLMLALLQWVQKRGGGRRRIRRPDLSQPPARDPWQTRLF